MRTPIVTDILEMQIANPSEPSVLRVIQVGGVQLHDNLRREVLPKMEPSDNQGVILDLSAAQFTPGTIDQAVKLLLRVVPIAGLQVVGLLRGSGINGEMAEKFNLSLEDLPRSLRADFGEDVGGANDVVSNVTDDTVIQDETSVFERAQVVDIDAAVFDTDAASATIRKVIAGQFDFGDDITPPVDNALPAPFFLDTASPADAVFAPVALVDADATDLVEQDIVESTAVESVPASVAAAPSPEVATTTTEAPAFILSQARQMLSDAEIQAVDTVRQAEAAAAALVEDARKAGSDAAEAIIEQGRIAAETEAGLVAAQIKEAAETSARAIVEEARRTGQVDADAIIASAREAAATAAEGILSGARAQAALDAAALVEESQVAARDAAAVVLADARAQGEAACALLTQKAEQAAATAAESVIQSAARAAEHQSAFIIDEARTIAQSEASAILEGVRNKAETEAARIVEEAKTQAATLIVDAHRQAEQGALEVVQALIATAESDASALVTAARTQAESITAQAVAAAQTSKQAAESDAVNIVAEALERGSQESEALREAARQSSSAAALALKDQVLGEATTEASRIIEQARITAEAATIRTKAQARQDAQAEATTILTTANAAAAQTITEATAEAERIVQAASAEATRIVATACEEASSQGDRLLGDALQVVERVCRSANPVSIAPAPSLEPEQTPSAARQMVDDAISSGGGYLPSSHTQATAEAFAEASEASGVAVDVRTALIHTLRVRTGAVIVAEDRDLVVVGAVSTGAELKADGNIHVYGALHGRVMAGISGNNQAQIFCQAFHGEYISIGDSFATFEQVPQEIRGAAVRFWADDTGIHYERLGQFS